jgi:GntR family transcriptional regulator/MocR family aminotransferase
MRRAPSGIVPILPLDRGSRTPLYRQLYQGFKGAILERRLRAGQRIPSTRSLAVELRVSRLPLLIAYEQLVAEGYLESRTGSGTFVASVPVRPPTPNGAGTAASGRGRRFTSKDTDFLLTGATEPWLAVWGAFRVSEPAVDRFPHEIWSRLVGRHARAQRESTEDMRYGDPMGHRPFREAVAAYLRTSRAVRCEADQVMAVSGSSSGAQTPRPRT